MTTAPNPFGSLQNAETRGAAGAPPERPTLEALFGKPVPQAPEAEMALLGAMMLDPRVTGDVIMLVKSAGMFYGAVHARIFQALVMLYDRHQAGDVVQLWDALREDEGLKQVGGVEYLEKLMSETPGPAGAVHWARMVADKARLRSLINTASDIIHSAYTLGQGAEENAAEILDKAEQQIFEIARRHELFEPQAMAELIQQEYDRLEALQGQGMSGVATGYFELDRMLCGLQAGEMIVIAARPSMGKTALAMNLAEQVALGGTPFAGAPTGAKVPVGFFSLEMSKSAVAQRLLSARSGVSSHDMRSGSLKPGDIDRILAACGELHDSPIYVDDMPGLTVMGLRARARRMVQQYGVRALFVDYLQLMTAPQFARESRQVEVAAISRGIKSLARELNMPVVCLSQLNRGPESRSDNRPRMSDLRESGSIEQDADVVMLLHREEYYHVGDTGWLNDPDNTDKIGVAELIIAKQRNGPTGVVELLWDAETTRFKNLRRSQTGGYADAPGPVQQEVKQASFAPGKKSGPMADYRDGGGPDRPATAPFTPPPAPPFTPKPAGSPSPEPFEADDDESDGIPI